VILSVCLDADVLRQSFAAVAIGIAVIGWTVARHSPGKTNTVS